MKAPAAGTGRAGQRVAIVSGASRGIGAACARHLFETGWTLSLGMREPVQPEVEDLLDVPGIEDRHHRVVERHLR